LAQTYISFDAPGAGTGPDQGTFPTAITRNGFIGVTVKDNNSFSHGFVRLANGKFTKVQPPHSIDTHIAGVNWRGQVAGSFFDKVGGISHGYVKNANGTYVQLDVPGAIGGTSVSGINSTGQVAGTFFGPSGGQAFFWDPANPGEYVTFTVPGSAGTNAAGVNDGGEITGSYGDSAGSHGYVRTKDGTITTFDFGGTSRATSPVAINTKGQVAGSESDEGVGAGFLRTPLGHLIQFGSESHGGPQPEAISDTGAIVGFEFSEGGGNVAFVRDAAGNYTFLAVPFANTATSATGVNRSGQIVGAYADSNGASHGWLLTP
jgi:uncharacterized membrane protein